jgi:hypothetical protein
MFAAIEYNEEAAASDEGEKGSHRIRRLDRNGPNDAIGVVRMSSALATVPFPMLSQSQQPAGGAIQAHIRLVDRDRTDTARHHLP